MLGKLEENGYQVSSIDNSKWFSSIQPSWRMLPHHNHPTKGSKVPLFDLKFMILCKFKKFSCFLILSSSNKYGYRFYRTYHKVELHAGPNVNLILGPNGTGKSTIVCAICIGLAGKPKILGRANSLKEYIRHECTSASIEIELFNPDGDNFVVKRSIQASNTSAISSWMLNGKRCSQTQVGAVL